MSRALTKAEDKNAFLENLQQKDFIVKKEIFHYKTNPVRSQLINFIIQIKGKRRVDKKNSKTGNS